LGNYTSTRNINDNNADFWSVFTIGAWSTTNGSRGAYGGNMAYIFNDTITTEANNANLNIAFCKETTFLHELGHSMGLVDQGVGSTSIMWSGVNMTLAQRINNNYVFFLDSDIKTIQQQIKPI
jgi:hypothetical protein